MATMTPREFLEARDDGRIQEFDGWFVEIVDPDGVSLDERVERLETQLDEFITRLRAHLESCPTAGPTEDA